MRSSAPPSPTTITTSNWSSTAQQIKELKDIGPLSIVGGYLTVPEEPGMGPQPDWGEVERQAVMVV